MKCKFFFLLSALIAISFSVKANNLTISNTSYDGANTITFDLSWENSWRTSTTQPYNYDGVWIFVKVRECTEKNLGSPSAYTHAWLSTTASDHSATASTGGETLTLEVGTTAIDGSDRGMGIFVYQTADVTEATNISTTVTLTWDKSTQAGEMDEIDDADNYDVQVFGVEMVNIPQGEYYLGDGSSQYCFENEDGDPIAITSEGSLYAEDTYNRMLTDSTGGSANIGADFPKGYNDFWIMKYEITQYQYAEFLNTITPDQANERTTDDLFTMTTRTYVMSNSTSIASRQAIILDPEGDVRTDRFYVNFDNDYTYNESSDGLGIACNYLSLRDVLAYLDWAALRPLTELEYEKACRGPKSPQAGEYAWGNVAVTSIGGVSNPGKVNEIAINSGTGLCCYNGTSGGASGPMRVGFAATASTNRTQAGCSYYGVMELSGNVREPYVSFYNSTDISNTFNGESGDGELDESGYQNVDSWPSNTGDADFSTFLAKGGDWSNSTTYLQVSQRRYNSSYEADNWVSTRNSVFGGRGGR